MFGTTVRIHDETNEALRDLKRQTGQTAPEILALAVDGFYRSLLVADTNCGYAALQQSKDSEDEKAELAIFEGSLGDGLD